MSDQAGQSNKAAIFQLDVVYLDTNLTEIQCDEVHPLCGPCRKHCICCYYDRPDPNVRAREMTRSPTSATSTSTIDLIARVRRNSSPTSVRPPPWFGCPDKRILDLQLMNWYTYISCTARPEISARTRELWAYEIPQKALGCDYLLYSVLSYSSLYIHIHNPHDQDIAQVAHSYFGKAIRSLSAAVAHVNDGNAEYLFAASLLIALQAALAWKDPCTQKEGYQLPIQWFLMGRGVRSILKVGMPAIKNTSMNVMVEAPKPRDPGKTGTISATLNSLPSFDDSPDVLAMIKVRTFLKCLYEAVQAETLAFARYRLTLFPIVLSDEFFEMLRMHDPRALIALAYYFAAMKNLEGYWWYDGRAKHEITGIAGLLPDSWLHRIAWPLEAIEGRNTGIPDWKTISECIPLSLAEVSP